MAMDAARRDGEQFGSGGLVGEAVRAITRHIRENELMPGDRLPSETILSKTLNVSRPVVREAFRSLAAMRIIALGTGRRATVGQIEHGPISLLIEHGVYTEQISVQQIYDVRRTIEARIAALAALRRTEAEAAALIRHAEAMLAAADDPAGVMENDILFHTTLAGASRNPVFALIVGAFGGIIRQTWLIGWRSRTTAESRQRMLDTHLALARAVEAGDPLVATRLMDLHFDESVRALLVAGLG
jgi:DNA-binding FadR family transcriptional regulator